MKVWTERSMYTDNNQKITLQPTEDMSDSKMVINVNENRSNSDDIVRVYITLDEAETFANMLLEEVKSRKE